MCLTLPSFDLCSFSLTSWDQIMLKLLREFSHLHIMLCMDSWDKTYDFLNFLHFSRCFSLNVLYPFKNA